MYFHLRKITTKKTYDRIYGIIASDFDNEINNDLIKELRKSTFLPSRPKLYDITNKEISVKFDLANICIFSFSSNTAGPYTNPQEQLIRTQANARW